MLRQVPIERLRGLDDAGLAEADVAERRGKFGRNSIVAFASSGWSEIAANTARDPMVWFLAVTTILYAWLGDRVQAAFIAATLIPIAGMDAFLHRRTQMSTEGLASRIALEARVIRQGRETVIPADDLVPGDLAVVAAGSHFPADGLIVGGDNLQADESSLTGESLPIRKQVLEALPTAQQSVAVDGVRWGMAGTRLLTGTARLRVVFTGGDTLYGEIVRLSQQTRSEQTPLQESIGRLVRILVVFALGLCGVLAAVRYYQGHGIFDAILSAITLAIAALPEEFPVVFTFFLGVGVYRLAQRQALIRRAVVIENIGRITCICTDKTGTLTQGRLALGEIMPAPGLDRDRLLAIAAAASRLETGDPLDLLLIRSAGQAVPADLGEVEALFPFTEDRRREVAILRAREGDWLAVMKGAPETVMAMARLSAGERAAWHDRIRGLAASGQKTIAVAFRKLDKWTGREPQDGYELAGLVGLADPIRPDAVAAVRTAQQAGIRVIMITGDHEQTAGAIASRFGIGGAAPRVIDGDSLARQLAAGVPAVDVVARCLPAQKLDLVRALRASGEIVAVTGDGVNDVPALRGADVGIAMGERGTRAAREAASIVLLDDDFATIIRAIREGRQLLVNLKLSFAYLLMVHAPLVATAAFVPLLGFPLLYLPAHIVWLELIMHPTALLVFQQLPSPGRLLPPGRQRRESFFSPRQWLVIGFVSLVATAVITLGYVFNLGDQMDVAHARSMAMAALVTASAATAAALSRLGSRNARIAAALALVSAIVAIEFPPAAALLQLSPLHAIDWMIAAGAGSLIGACAMAFAEPAVR